MVGMYNILPEPLVDENLQRDLGNFTALGPSNRPCCKVAGVCKGHFHFGIQLGKGCLGQIDFPADSQTFCNRKPQRNGGDGLDVGSHIVAHRSIATRHRPDKQPILIVQYNRDTVDFLLNDNPHVLADLGLCLLNPGKQLSITVGLVEAEHRDGMGHLPQRRVEVAAHPLSRRIGTLEVGILCLQGNQPVEEPVVLQITDQRTVVHIIGFLIGGKLLDKCVDFMFKFIHGSDCKALRSPIASCGLVSLIALISRTWYLS